MKQRVGSSAVPVTVFAAATLVAVPALAAEQTDQPQRRQGDHRAEHAWLRDPIADAQLEPVDPVGRPVAVRADGEPQVTRVEHDAPVDLLHFRVALVFHGRVGALVEGTHVNAVGDVEIVDLAVDDAAFAHHRVIALGQLLDEVMRECVPGVGFDLFPTFTAAAGLRSELPWRSTGLTSASGPSASMR